VNKATREFVTRVTSHVKEKQNIRRLMSIYGPELVQRLIRQCGSLRKVAKQSGLSPTYLSHITNRKMKLSSSRYLELSKLCSKTTTKKKQSKPA
jgi:AraC-like DNA-binding protein